MWLLYTVSCDLYILCHVTSIYCMYSLYHSMFVVHTITYFIYAFAHMHDLTILFHLLSILLSFYATCLYYCMFLLCFWDVLCVLLYISIDAHDCLYYCWFIYTFAYMYNVWWHMYSLCCYRYRWLSILFNPCTYVCLFYTVVYLFLAQIYVSSILLSVVYISIDIGLDDFLRYSIYTSIVTYLYNCVFYLYFYSYLSIQLRILSILL